MSFSSEVKKEIAKELPGKKCCVVAMCYGILLYCNTFAPGEIKIITGSSDFGKILPKLFKKAFGFGFDRISNTGGERGKGSYIIENSDKISSIFNTYGYSPGGMVAHHVNLSVIEDDCCRVSFLKGAFLAGGSVTDPAKRYHFEIATAHYNVSRETYSIFLELNFEPKETTRKGNYIIYLKQSEQIADLLTTLGAQISSMNLMSAKIEKGMMSSVNRQVNCDTANVKKTVDAARNQIDAIDLISRTLGLQNLPDKLRDTAILRLEHPELSISELAGIHAPPVSKSCLNHRLRKLMEVSEKLKEQESGSL